jgi:hypothetical protein
MDMSQPTRHSNIPQKWYPYFNFSSYFPKFLRLSKSLKAEGFLKVLAIGSAALSSYSAWVAA